MARNSLLGFFGGSVIVLLSIASGHVFAQTFGVELNNTLMPAAGAMGGVGIARPQDLTSAINANPATLTQFRGTQVLFGGAWAEPTFNISQHVPVPLLGVEPYSGKSTAQGLPVGNIGVTQDLSALGLPAAFGVAFVTTSGGFVDFRQVPESNGTNSAFTSFSLPAALGVDLTERLHVGGSLALGIAFFDAPFVGLGGMTPDCGLRGAVGLNYDLAEDTTLGAYYQTAQHFRFDNAIEFPIDNSFHNVRMDLPQNIGFGLANQTFMDGHLLLATDVLYKLWDEADLYRSVYDNQWAVQVGAQYTTGKYKLRAGYVWAENPLDNNPGANIGGVTPPGGFPAVRYTQGLMAVTCQHRISAGIGVSDVLPGVDLDLMAGGMFRDTQQLSRFTTTSIESYWIGVGLTWRFGRGACEDLAVPDDWGCASSY